MMCKNEECPYWRENEECPAALGCPGYEDDENMREEERDY